MFLKEITITYIDEIKQIYRSVFGSPPWNENWEDESQIDEYLKELIEVRNSLLYGLYDDSDKLVGISLGKLRHWYGGTEYFIEELCILTELQGQGIGGEFLDLIKNELIRKDIHQIYLMTDRDKPAYRFYGKHGFKELPELTSFFAEF